MKKRIIKEEGKAVKLGSSTDKAGLYIEYLVNKVNKEGGTSFLEVNEKKEIILHQQEAK